MLHPINWSLALPYFAAALAFGYLLGSIPFGLMITRLAGTQDLRTIGSGNIGATNVLRTGRKGLAALTLVCDALKGTVAVLVAFHFGGQDLAVLAALGAFLGHLFPVWLRFNGGKGVATFIGLLIAFAWLGQHPEVGLASWHALLSFGVVWLLVAAVTRYSSLAGLLASVACVLSLWWDGYLQEAQLFALLTVLIWAKHHHNISRLVAGTESKIGR
jgi:glycerol-3-phosphate acyltransferase PlsY